MKQEATLTHATAVALFFALSSLLTACGGDTFTNCATTKTCPTSTSAGGSAATSGEDGNVVGSSQTSAGGNGGSGGNKSSTASESGGVAGGAGEVGTLVTIGTSTTDNGIGAAGASGGSGGAGGATSTAAGGAGGTGGTSTSVGGGGAGGTTSTSAGGVSGTGGTGGVDECATGAHNCSEHASCSDTEESFICSCDPGYQGDGVTCNCGLPSTNNVLADPGFALAKNAADWEVWAGASWVEDDAGDCDTSGSIQVEVTSTLNFGTVVQCVRASAGTTYFFGFSYKQEASSRLGCYVWTYASTDCSGGIVNSLRVQGAEVATALDWTVSTPDSITTSPGVASAEIYCQLDSAGTGYFDNMYFNPVEAAY